jgi:hypothetical protein
MAASIIVPGLQLRDTRQELEKSLLEEPIAFRFRVYVSWQHTLPCGVMSRDHISHDALVLSAPSAQTQSARLQSNLTHEYS